MRYVTIYCDKEPDFDCYAVQECRDKDGKSYWLVLLTREQYEKRLADNKECVTFSVADPKYKTQKSSKDIPLHSFCGHIADPLVVEKEQIKCIAQ